MDLPIPIDPALLEDEGGMEDAEGEVDEEYEYEHGVPAYIEPAMPAYPRASSSKSSIPIAASPGAVMKKKRKGRPVGSTNKTRPVNGHTHTHTHIHGKGKGKGKAAAAALPTHRQPADIVCSFCEGGDQRNKLGVPEKMVSCALCGRSGHPSCLQMTSRLAKTVMTYGWTCLDCKACEICEMRDQDVMFCDGCDRGYHRWCLDPPLAVEPHGAWYCTLCLPANLARKRQSKGSSSVTQIIHPKPLESPGSPGRRRGRPPKTLPASRLSKSVQLGSDGSGGEEDDVFMQLQPRIKIKGRRSKGKGKDRQHLPGKGAEVSPSLVVKIRVPSGGARKAVEIESEEEKVPYGGIITGADADTTRTTITDSDKDRFQKSLSAAESKLGGPPPLLPDYDPQLSIRGSPAPSSSLTNGHGNGHGRDKDADNEAYTPSLSRTTSTPQLNRGLRDRLLQQTVSGSGSFSLSTPGPSTPLPNGNGHGPAGMSEKIKRIRFGVFDIDTWYSAPYPEEYQNVPDGRLWLCEFCLKYMKSGFVAERHRLKCKTRHPPGDEIYRDHDISVFEVDGRKNKIYCQNLCLLAKMFLDHKTLYYDVEPFLFYVMTEVDDLGARFVGYFSKEKRSIDNNVSCIMTLPVRQRKGWGQLLIDFSYALSKKENRVGSPEKPLSGLGEVTYKRYWKITIFEHLRTAPSTVTMDDISAATSLTIEDIYATLLAEDMIISHDSPPRERSLHTPTRGRGRGGRGRGRGSINRRAPRADSQTETDGVSSSDSKPVIPKRYTIRFDRAYIEAVMVQHQSRGYLTLKPDRLKYHPFLVTRDPVKPPGTIAKATLMAAGAGGAGLDLDNADADADPGTGMGKEDETPEVIAHGQDKATLQLVAKLSESPARSLRKRPASSSEPASVDRSTRPRSKRARHDSGPQQQVDTTPRRSTRGSAPASAQKLRQVIAESPAPAPAQRVAAAPVTNGYTEEELDEDGEWEADDDTGADEDAEGEDEYVED